MICHDLGGLIIIQRGDLIFLIYHINSYVNACLKAFGKFISHSQYNVYDSSLDIKRSGDFKIIWF